jgi:CDP-glycerol glycerophosphotransferase (TagB/SpsB family)
MFYKLKLLSSIVFDDIILVVSRIIYRILLFRNILPNRIVFISYPDAADNSLAMFRYLQGRPEHRDVIWLVSREDSAIAMRLQGARLITRRSLRGMAALASARLVFHTHGLPRYVNRRSDQVIVNLWHGMPLKKISALHDDKSSVPIGDYAIATSELFRRVMARAFLLPPERVLVTGQPRNDGLFRAMSDHGIPLWMPTFRHSHENAVRWDSLLSPEGFIRILRDVDTELVARDLRLSLKLHPMDLLNSVLRPDFDAIDVIFGHDQRQSVEDLLAGSSALITDYSSAAIDYLVLQRPIGYFCPDLDQYTRGYIDEVEPAYFAAGTMLRELDALIDFIASPAMPAVDRSADLVVHRDGGSAQRLWQQLQVLEGVQ